MTASLFAAEKEIAEFQKKLTEIDKKERAYYLNKISIEYRSIDPQKSMEFAEKALFNAKLFDNILEMGNAHHNIGVAFHHLGDYENALINYDQAINYRNSVGDKKGLANSFFNKGLIEKNLGNHQYALNFFNRTLTLLQNGDNNQLLAKTYEKISDVYRNLSNYEKALEYDLSALKLHEESDNEIGIADAMMNIGSIYFQLESYETALQYFQNSLKICQELDQKKGIASSLNGLGTIYGVLKKYDKALEHFQQSLRIRRDIEDKKGTADVLNNLGSIYWETNKLNSALRYYKLALNIYTEINDNYRIAKINYNIGNVYLKQKTFPTAYNYFQTAKKLAKTINARDILADIYHSLSDYYSQKKDYQNSFNYYQKYATLKDSILNETKSEQIAEMQTKYETEKKEKEIQILKKDQTIQELQIKRQTLQRNSLIAVLLSLTVLAFVIFNRYKFEKKAHQKLEEANKLIKKEKETSDKLLLNILPERVAKELKEKGKTTPESYDNVTILFSDFVNFTKKSSLLEPNILINELNDIFTGFDDIIEKNHCERIKTIGDAYLAVCGLPEPNQDHAENIMRSALEIMHYLKRRNSRTNNKWQIRIGIHSGSVVGGVVGVKKYIFDIFGDALNTASRMESNSEKMKINVSETTYNLLSDKFIFIKRKPWQVKGKGKMNMYFVDIDSYEN